MIIPDTDLSIMSVRNYLGAPYTDIGMLCTSSLINKYSRYRPGYWYPGTSQDMYFQLPKGGSYTDPRGADENGISLQVFRLGDFRGYNTAASAPSVSGDNPLNALYDSTASSTQSVTVAFNLGEVDWWGDETNYRGKNVDFGGCTQVVAVNQSTSTVIGYCDKANLEWSGNYARCSFTVSISVPSTTVIKFGLGKGGKLYYYFPDASDLTIIASKTSSPSYNIHLSTDGTGATNLFNNLSGDYTSDETNVYQLDLTPTSGTFNAGASSIGYTTTAAVVTMYPTYNRYSVIQARWLIYYTVKRETMSTGAVLETFSGSMTLAANGSGVYPITIPLNQSAVDGEYYDISLTDFGTTQITSISN